MKDRRSHLVSFIAGLLFAIGLGLAGMTNSSKVLNFLDLFGDWDPSLALVMGGAILVYAPVYRKLRGESAPKLADRFHWPTKQDIDVRLVVGSILFGIGWGIAGFCPGPAIVAATSGHASVLAFFAAMVLGMLGQRLVARQS
ncbi:MAG TPA: YeeE/YedE family protein [Enhygromyxa sp.]|nr:YeeE/YedE family protein [Enhygromyxa sp.]